MKITVFYSWQSDKPGQVNRNVIEDAINLAIARIVSDNEFTVEPALDRDTQNIPGSPVIAETILLKIDHCGLFLADVTMITEATTHRSSPNPNVLLELGYAAARVGWERIICVMNEYYGKAENLPFDLKHRRWPIRYKLSDKSNNTQIIEIKKTLTDSIEYAIRSIIQSGIITSTLNPKDRRVAIKLNNALNGFVGSFANFLTSHGYDDGMKMILQNFPDKAGSEYPDPHIVDPILT
jgi:hypothetical protein